MQFTDEIFEPHCWRCSGRGSFLWPEGSALQKYDEDKECMMLPKGTPNIANVVFYAATMSAVFFSYRVRLDAVRDCTHMAHKVAQDPTELVRERVQRGDEESMLELAMRYGTGCETEEGLDKSIELIEQILARAAQTAQGPTTTRVPEHVLQRTHSAAALVFHSKYLAKGIVGTTLAYHHDPDLFRAATEADRAAADGLPSRAALLVARHLVALAKKHKMKPGPQSDARFGGFKKIWEALVAYDKLVTRIQGKPNMWWCGARDCDACVPDKHQFKRCGGSCPPATKPIYCTKQCQGRDWKARHKAEGCVTIRNLDGDARMPGSGD